MAIIGREQMEKRVFGILSPFLRKKVKGGVYRSECRPQDSGKEDAEVVVNTVTAGQVQKGVVKVNIYVQDICTDQRALPDKARLAELESLANEMLSMLETKTLGRWGFSCAPDNFAVPNVREHMLNFSFDFAQFNN